MATMTAELTGTQREGLRALCDTVVPSIEHEPDPSGLWARSATDIGTEQGVEQILVSIPDPEIQGGMLELLDALAAPLAAADSQEAKEAAIAAVGASSPDAAAGIDALVRAVLFVNYGAPDPETGLNANWEAYGYPGPPGPPPDVPKPLKPLELDDEHVELTADVCVVGSGSGGGVVAATLAKAGQDVLVMDAAGYFNESDFTDYELDAYEKMYWRGGPNPTVEGNATIVAGTTLGGGTTINWTNCLRTRPWVREQWAGEHGLEGVDGKEFDGHLDAVLERIGATDQCSDLNGPQQRMKEGSEKLGWSFETIVRNTDPAKYSPDTAAFIGFGDASGSKQSGDRTWLADAADAGARLAVRCRAQKILVEGAKAAGVEAVRFDETGTPVGTVTVRAPQVVVACGALESPALLLRSGIGGPAVGSRLHLHPTTAVLGIYGEETKAWWGPPQAGLCDEFADTGQGYGFLIEASQYAPALIGSAIPWGSAVEHKQAMADVRHAGTMISLTRDRGHGSVTVDSGGEAVPAYPVTDEMDIDNLRKGLAAQARIHEAGGAERISALAVGAEEWSRGQDLEVFISSLERIPFGAGGCRLFSAHQMGTCPMGADPATSVAGPYGELHDVKGVWIGDGSAFPTSSGTNPMVSIMALARRTATAMAAA